MKVLERNKVCRISVSLPEKLLPEFDKMVTERGFQSRSQAIVEMINSNIADHKQTYGDTIMAGTINLVYDYATPGLQALLADLQRNYINEVIRDNDPKGVGPFIMASLEYEKLNK